MVLIHLTTCRNIILTSKLPLRASHQSCFPSSILRSISPFIHPWRNWLLPLLFGCFPIAFGEVRWWWNCFYFFHESKKNIVFKNYTVPTAKNIMNDQNFCVFSHNALFSFCLKRRVCFIFSFLLLIFDFEICKEFFATQISNVFYPSNRSF